MPSQSINRIIVILLVLIQGSKVVAQEESSSNASRAKRFSGIEVFGGIGYVYLRQGSSDPHRQDVPNVGYAFGFARSYILSDHIQIEGKIMYEKKGGKQYDDEQTNDSITHLPIINRGGITTIHNYECISLPILVRYDFGRKIKYQVKAGPYFSYLLKATNSTKSSVNQFQYTNDITADMNNDIGYSLVFGVEIPIPGNRNLSIQIVNSNGLINISKSPNPSYPINLKTNSLLLVLGVPLSRTGNN